MLVTMAQTVRKDRMELMANQVPMVLKVQQDQRDSKVLLAHLVITVILDTRVRQDLKDRRDQPVILDKLVRLAVKVPEESRDLTEIRVRKVHEVTPETSVLVA